MSDSFNVGDVVRLKSGGPKMTVEYIDPGSDAGMKVDCVWFEDRKREIGTFAAAALEKV